MRILKLQFTNINSLAGTWQVDFSGPAYVHGGIFAITGPTGAGKSTILDAICLALYGCTPRLKSISISENEAMTRLTSVCSAEVTFQTQAGVYRCTWSQRRAHGKADGNLQQPKHEIVDAKTGIVIESQIRKVASKIIEVTGMDIDQFTRSMLLAQGKFATFLFADANERGPVLEQITGTEIYSKISAFVYERWAAEKKELERIAIELGGMDVMSDEDRAARRGELDERRRRSEELNSEAEALRSMIAWHQHLSKLEADLADAEEAWKRFEVRNAEADALRAVLIRAEQAAVLEANYLPLMKLREESMKLRGSLGISLDRMPGAVRLRGEAQQRLDEARSEREVMHKRLQADSVLWKKVRDLDATIREKRKTHAEYEHVLEERKRDLERQSERMRSLGGEAESIRAEKAELQEYFDAHASDASLAESMGAIVMMVEAVQSVAAKLGQKRSQLEAAGREVEKFADESEQARRQCEVESRNSKAAADASAASDARVENILRGRDAASLRSQSNALTERERLLDEAQRLLKELDDVGAVLKNLDEKRSVQASRQEKGRLHEAQALTEKAAKQKDVDHCDEILRMQQTIDSLVEHRAHLQDGVPCPLCGSTEHPYAMGQAPRADEKLEALTRAKAELEAASARLQKYSTELAKIESDISHLDELIAEKSGLVTSLKGKAEQTSAAAGVQCELSAVAAEADNVRARKREIEQLVRGADAAIEARDKARKEADEAQKSAHASQLRYEQASARSAKAREDRLRLASECNAASNEIDELLSDLRKRCEPYGIAAVEIGTAAAAGESLKKRRDEWEQRARNFDNVEKREKIIAPELKSAEALVGNLGGLAEKAEQDAIQCGNECGALEMERRSMFGETDPDEEEKKRNEAIAEIDRSITACAKEAEQRTTELAALEKEIAMIRTQLEECDERLGADEKEFSGRLSGAGFGSEEEFSSVRLPEDKRSELQRIVNELRDEGQRLESVRGQKRMEVERERGRNVTGKTAEEVSTELRGAEDACAQAQQAIGALENRLRSDEEQRSARGEKQAEQERKQRTYRRWDDLNELIGSASGKKFQKIAQSVTFEMMVAHANKVLRKMSPRYVLVCDAKTDLELNIVDQYQACEVRSTKNLSGGESFIVSLSLALGLSQMASRNVRVDSLFLDEGFGTLDEEALDVALTTLSELQQEGKTIGVISHVGALKERISTQIVVTPETGGRSTLSGPGCRRIN